ncbi:hypothetical protein ACVIRO_004833 [Rhizobium ruizarguesonis]
MDSLLVGGLVFVFLSTATSTGLIVRARLPNHHLNAESKDVIRLATAVVGTLSALALGLLIASAKSSYDNAEVEMRTAAARILLLDRVMAQYGPETDNARQLLRELIEKRLSRGWTAETTDADIRQGRGRISGYRDGSKRPSIAGAEGCGAARSPGPCSGGKRHGGRNPLAAG